MNGIVKGERPNLPTNKPPIPAVNIVDSIDINTIGATTYGIYRKWLSSPKWNTEMPIPTRVPL